MGHLRAGARIRPPPRQQKSCQQAKNRPYCAPGTSLSSKRVRRRLVISLAWLTPTKPDHRLYRSAALWFDPPRDVLLVERQEVHGRAVRRGTIQHEVLDGDQAAPFVDGDELQVQVSCRAHAGELDEPVPYALIVTLEVAEAIDLPIYDEIRARIRPRIRIVPEVGTSDQ